MADREQLSCFDSTPRPLLRPQRAGLVLDGALFAFAFCAASDGLWWLSGSPYSDAHRWLHGGPE